MQVIPENTNPKWEYYQEADFWELEANQFRLLVECSHKSGQWAAWVNLGYDSDPNSSVRYKNNIPTEAEAKAAAIEMAKDFAVSMLGILTNVEVT